MALRLSVWKISQSFQLCSFSLATSVGYQTSASSSRGSRSTARSRISTTHRIHQPVTAMFGPDERSTSSITARCATSARATLARNPGACPKTAIPRTRHRYNGPLVQIPQAGVIWRIRDIPPPFQPSAADSYGRAQNSRDELRRDWGGGPRGSHVSCEATAASS